MGAQLQCTVLCLRTLCVAGGGAYYFAKRSINADKKARHEADMKRRQAVQSSDDYSMPTPPKKKKRRTVDYTSSPSTEASHDPAPTRHAPENEGQQVQEKSKYEASVPFRSKRGDRFS